MNVCSSAPLLVPVFVSDVMFIKKSPYRFQVTASQ
jgi:hypothetical protein